MNSDTSPVRTPPDFSRTPRLVPTSTRADSDDIRLAPDGAPDQFIDHQRRADASLALPCAAGYGSALEFVQFEQGAGI
jgi:hypothetical protein